MEKSAPQTAEKRAQAQAAQKQALVAAQEEARLEGQLLEAKRAEGIRKKAEETRLAQQARQKEAEAFTGKLQEAQARMEKGLACEAQYRAGAERLPALVEERARLEKALSSLEELEKRQNAEADERRSQIGTGDRSEKIRTYNFPQGRVTDHRIKLTLYKIDSIMNGDIQELLDGLITADQARRLSRLEEQNG